MTSPPRDAERQVALETTYAGRRRRPGRWAPWVYLSAPVTILLVFFAGPLGILAVYSFQERSRTGDGSWTLANYAAALQPRYLETAANTVVIAVVSMVLLLAIAYPLAYLIAFRVGARWEVPLLLALALSDELNPLIRIYAWRTVLGRNGLVNTALEALGVIDAPLDWLIFTKFSVVVVLTASWLPYAVIPLYAAMKTIDPRVLEAARDLGAGWWVTFRKVVFPLTAAGFLATIVIVFIPLISDFAAPALVGGTSGRMLASVIEDLFLGRGQWGVGSALTFVLLAASGVVVWLSYRIADMNSLDTSR
ncbi:MAG TPA: ABC transporter permease [Actinobacteria bacterium]|nr:ABC transporter permease [Actinomycetota bacterium]